MSSKIIFLFVAINVTYDKIENIELDVSNNTKLLFLKFFSNLDLKDFISL